MKQILNIIDQLRGTSEESQGKKPLINLGFISHSTALQIKHVPFYEPCLILVLKGKKTISRGATSTVCEAGSLVAVPAPSSYDLRNEPDPRTGRYSALIIPFTVDTLERLRASHNLFQDVNKGQSTVLKYEADDELQKAITHYLETINTPNITLHRLMEILLVLLNRTPSLLSFTLHRDSWEEKIRAVVSADLMYSWTIDEVASKLATSESTLRRHLKKENTSFREIVFELRLATALMQLLQTDLPVNQIAYECGYKSASRFTSNFHKRFGLPPKEIRLSVNDSE